MTIPMLFLMMIAASSYQHVHPQGKPNPPSGTPSALSADLVKQLLDGEGMGLARPAEGHDYPGPKHLLDRAAEIGLTAAQQTEIAAIRRQVVEQARALGAQIVEAERALDAAFTSGTLEVSALQKHVAAIASLNGELRLVHLRAHLLTRPLLTAEQVRAYYQKR